MHTLLWEKLTILLKIQVGKLKKDWMPNTKKSGKTSQLEKSPKLTKTSKCREKNVGNSNLEQNEVTSLRRSSRIKKNCDENHKLRFN